MKLRSGPRPDHTSRRHGSLPVATAFAVLLPGLAQLGGCSRIASEAAKAPTLEAATDVPGAKCSLATSKPLVIEWPVEDRGALETRMRRGITAVRYTGCELTIIDRCAVPRSAYAYSGFTPKHEDHAFSTTDDLHAKMPIGASTLEASLQASGRLDLTITVVGRFESSTESVRADELEGEGCARATHFLRAASVGAFRLNVGGEATVGGGATTPELALGGAGHAERSALKADGDEDACKLATEQDADPPRACGALLRLELIAIDGRTRPASVVRKERVCPSGERWSGSACVEDSEDAGGSGVERFAVRGNTVFDTTTGLTWQRIPSPRRMGWEAAKAYCQSLEVDGLTSFHLPKKSELMTLVLASSRTSPRIDALMFPDTPAARFWTFSADRSSPGDAWAVDFAAGQPRSSGTGKEHDVRCVR